MDKVPSLAQLLESYKQWVYSNPNVVTDVETVVTWSSYFIAGKINNSPAVSELVYAISKLLSLYNDRLIYKAYGNEDSQPGSSHGVREKIKLWLSVLHYSEVFIELVARKKWNTRGKWTAITIVQLVKSASALVLLYKYREMPILHPPVPVLQRKKFMESKTSDENSNEYFLLKRSGRAIRRVEGCAPMPFRDWQPPRINSTDSIVHKDIDRRNMVTAEMIHIVKPLIHLAAMGCFGDQSWKQWLISLGLDVASHRLYSKELLLLTTDQKLELSRRKLALVLYLLRSPIYNLYSEQAIGKLLKSLSKKVPITEFICNPILQYLSHWQDIYFYMWTS